MSATTTKNNQVAVELLVPFLIYKFVVGEDPSTSAYNLRLLWQKIGYLAKQVGLPLNEYQFNWYLRGPYSSAYTSTLYDIEENYDELHFNEKKYSLNEHSIESLIPLREMANNIPDGLSLPIWFELLASIHFLQNKTRGDMIQVYNKLIKLKPALNDYDNFVIAYEELKRENLL